MADRAEELAKKYCEGSSFNDACVEKPAYITGYHQAEKDINEQRVQYDSIESGIKAHAETYSFNIESMLFPQLTKEQQALWRKEIEQAVISGGECGLELANDTRYKENNKDLALTVEDIYKIISIDQQVCSEYGISDYVNEHEKAMEEVLKQFNESRK